MDKLSPQLTDSLTAADELSSVLREAGMPEVSQDALMLALLQAHGGILLVKSLTTGRYVYASEGGGKWLGLSAQQLRGRSDAELMNPDEAASLRKVEQAVQLQTGAVLSEHKLERAGHKHEFHVIRIAAGSNHLCAIWLDRTQHRNTELQLKRALDQIEQQQADHEQLRREIQEGSSGRDITTGLFLRAHFDDQLRREVDLSTREHREFALVLIALDPLNPAAAALGPQARQNLLEGLGRLLRNNTRAMDASCRVGDEEFAVLLSGVGLATAHARMEQLRRQCASQIVVLAGQDLGMSVSMGVSSFPHTASSQEELMAASANALADAKRRGGNHVALATISFVAAAG